MQKHQKIETLKFFVSKLNQINVLQLLKLRKFDVCMFEQNSQIFVMQKHQKIKSFKFLVSKLNQINVLQLLKLSEFDAFHAGMLFFNFVMQLERPKN